MNNLLPPQYKQNIRYARHNRALLTWVAATFAGIAGVGVVIAAGLFYIQYQTDAYAQQVDRSEASLAQQDLNETQDRIKGIDDSVQLALQVLSKEVQFSKLMRAIGGVMPAGSSLTGLTISDVEGAIDLQVVAEDYQTATQVQVNLEDPANQVFEKADVLNIGCGSAVNSEGVAVEYPCQVSLRALFADDNPYQLSASTGGGS